MATARMCHRPRPRRWLRRGLVRTHSCLTALSRCDIDASIVPRFRETPAWFDARTSFLSPPGGRRPIYQSLSRRPVYQRLSRFSALVLVGCR